MSTVAEAEYEPPHEEMIPPLPDVNPDMALQEAPTYDEDLRRVMAARRHPDNFEELLRASDGLMAVVVDKYFLQGGTRDDLLQEAMIGFYKSVTEYDGIGSAFTTFATMCMDRRLQNVIRDSSTQKHSLLNYAVSLDHNSDSDQSSSEHRSLQEELEDRLANPERTAEQRQFLYEVLGAISGELTTVESACVILQRLSDEDHEQTARTLGIDIKEVHNALRRAMRKMPDFDDVTTSLM